MQENLSWWVSGPVENTRNTPIIRHVLNSFLNLQACRLLIFIAIQSIFFLSQPEFDQIVSNFLYSVVHSIVNLKQKSMRSWTQKTREYTRNPLDYFPCFFRRLPWCLPFIALRCENAVVLYVDNIFHPWNDNHDMFLCVQKFS